MQHSSFSRQFDKDLLGKFDSEILNRTPHVAGGDKTGVVANPTPLVDLTDALSECAKAEYGIRIDSKRVRVFGKLDSQIFGGSVKVRPAVEIVRDAIITGKLRSGQKIFEATSGNFGICPAPGLKIDQNLVVAKAAAANVREQLAQLGLDTSVLDKNRGDVEALLAKQDVISLAKLLAKIYNGFCPEQYDNELNVRSHETTTAPEIDQQLKAHGYSLGDFRIITAFGTGGTSAGLAKYAQAKYGQKPVHVVFPLANQDVAGIRTRDKAVGLRFYQPELYGGEHEVDFEAARRLLRFFAGRGYGIGESGALALYSALQMINYGAGSNFVVMIADGLQKYLADLEVPVETSDSLEVNVQEANSKQQGYGEVLWTHAMFVPREEGVKLVAEALGCDEDKVKVATARDVQSLITTERIPAGINALLPKDKSKTLLVCMAGGTSLRVAEVLAKNGVVAQSLTGGIMNLSQTNNRQPEDLVQVATE